MTTYQLYTEIQLKELYKILEVMIKPELKNGYVLHLIF